MLYGFNVFFWADCTSNSRTGISRVTMRLYTNKCDDSQRFVIASFIQNLEMSCLVVITIIIVLYY